MKNNRTVAIVGRPNVGKSALFNRLAGRRLAIVHEQSGVTRDRLSCEVHYKNRSFELLDTGGIALMDQSTSKDVIESGTNLQVGIALEDASVLLFVVNVQVGITPLDTEVARILHQSDRPILLLANKADNSVLDGDAVEFDSLGFPVFPVSALHNRGLSSVLDEALRQLPQVPRTHTEKSFKSGRCRETQCR